MTKICKNCEEPEERHSWSFKKVPCKKFKPKMIGILEMAKRIKDEDRELAKNHSPLTNPEPDSVSRIDGGDLSSKIKFGVVDVPNIKDFIQKLKEEIDTGLRRTLWSDESVDYLLSEIDKLAGASLTGSAKDDLI